VTARATPRRAVDAALAALGLLAALATGRPAIAALAAPFLVLLVSDLARVRAPALRTSLRLSEARVLEGAVVDALVEVESRAPVERLSLELVVPPGLRLVDAPRSVLVRLAAGEQRSLRFPLAVPRWGAYSVGELRLRVGDAGSTTVYDADVDARRVLRAYPARERLRRLVDARRTTPFAGSQVSRARGDGIEFADIRPFAPGDRVRRINWRVSARTGRLHVSEGHPERAADVVLFLDGFAEARTADEGTIDRAVRAAGSLAEAYLARRDRVGLVSFGGTLRWLLPGSGSRQRVAILEALLETEVVRSYAWRDVDVIPRRILPPQALVVALTPLLDPRGIAALVDLRARRFDVVAIEVSPVALAAPRRAEVGELAWRVWLLWREALRDRCVRAGIPVVEWTGDGSLASAVEGVSTSRRHAQLSSAPR
jgi:uncharacterized protein (DUF58 family)